MYTNLDCACTVVDNSFYVSSLLGMLLVQTVFPELSVIYDHLLVMFWSLPLCTHSKDFWGIFLALISFIWFLI